MSHRSARLVTVVAAAVVGAAGISAIVADAASGSRVPDWLTEAGVLLVGAAAAVLILPAVLPAHVIKIRKGARPRGQRPVPTESAVNPEASFAMPPRDLAG